MASMQSAMDLFLSSAMYAVHTSLPARVEKYDAGKHTATVKPAVNMLMDNGVQIEIPSLMEVPVVFPASKFFDMEEGRFPGNSRRGVTLQPRFRRCHSGPDSDAFEGQGPNHH